MSTETIIYASQTFGTPIIIVFNANLMPFKMTKENYAAWRSQFYNLMYGHDLLDILMVVLHALLRPLREQTPPHQFLIRRTKFGSAKDSFILHGITHTSSTILTSPIASFTLKNVLCALKITKKFILVC